MLFQPKGPKGFLLSVLRDKLLRVQMVAAFLGSVFAVLVARYYEPKTDNNYTLQMRSLDNTKAAIGSLLQFVDEQKKQLRMSQAAIEALKVEQSRLQPVVEADRKLIDAMFAVQEQRSQAAQSRERWMGFGLGVLASLIASIVYSVVAAALRRRGQGKIPEC